MACCRCAPSCMVLVCSKWNLAVEVVCGSGGLERTQPATKSRAAAVARSATRAFFLCVPAAAGGCSPGRPLLP